MPGLGRSPGKGNGYPLQYSNLENSTDGTDSPWGCKESDVTFTFTLSSLVADGKASSCNAGDLGSIPGSGRSLEKETATHSSILAWRILWTEEPGGLQSTGLQKSDTTEQLHSLHSSQLQYSHTLKVVQHLRRCPPPSEIKMHRYSRCVMSVKI